MISGFGRGGSGGFFIVGAVLAKGGKSLSVTSLGPLEAADWGSLLRH